MLRELLGHTRADIGEGLGRGGGAVDPDVDMQLAVAEPARDADHVHAFLSGDLGDPLDGAGPHDGRATLTHREADLGAGQVGPRQCAQDEPDEEQEDEQAAKARDQRDAGREVMVVQAGEPVR
jgi:hypothetical protein